MRGAVVFAFDDVYLSTQLSYSVMQPNGIVATLPTVPGKVGSNINGNDICSWDQIDTMVAGGWECTNHSNVHADLTTLSAADLTTDVTTARSALMARGYPGTGYNHFVVPFHTTNETVRHGVMAAGHVSNRDTSGVAVLMPMTYDRKRAMTSMLYTPTDLAGVKTFISDAIAQGRLALINSHGGDTSTWGQIADWLVAQEYVGDCLTMTQAWARYSYLWERPDPVVNAHGTF